MSEKLIKYIGCHKCKNRKNCQLKYQGICVHWGVPVFCIIHGRFKRITEFDANDLELIKNI